MQTIARTTFTTVKTEGGLLPADLLQRISDGRDVRGLRPDDYHSPAGERLNEVINRSWNRCLGAWRSFEEQRRSLPDTDSGTTLTRERWLLPLFQELGYGRLQMRRSTLTAPDGTPYPISHLWEDTVPIHLVTLRQSLDNRSDYAPHTKRSPHSLVQEFLNRMPQYQWGFISNGLQLRLLRDNASLRRAAYVEFDLESMMNGELYAEFTLLWLVCHQSRVERREVSEEVIVTSHESSVRSQESEVTDDALLVTPDASPCWLEVWSKMAADQGTRALDALRDGVAEAIQALGRGFLAHPANGTLRQRLQAGELSSQEYYKQLRRMVYRLIFLYVAEDRDLLLLPDTDAATRRRYENYYSLRRLREMAADLRGGPHPDLYRQLRQLFLLLRKGYPELGLPGLGSFLFSPKSTPDLDTLELRNRDLLSAVFALAFTVENNVRRPVDYRNLDSEELGSVYESLLELHPQINIAAATFALTGGAGSERKTTGSHYTPTSLVECLLDSALEPVVADRLRDARRMTRESSSVTSHESSDASLVTHNSSSVSRHQSAAQAAILSIKVLDFASGSGHMLIGAGRRLARHLAQIHSGDEEPAPDVLRTAMREVVRHCLYGVDVNDMAVELCKVALWMETLEPGKPLSFLDKNIQCGNSLIGVTPGLDISEIPDDAFQPQTGDDKTTTAGLRRRNKKEREGQLALQFGSSEPEQVTDRYAGWRAEQMAALTLQNEDAVDQVEAKENAYAGYLKANPYLWSRLENDLWTAAFFWPIPSGDPGTMPAPTQQVLRDLRAGKTKGHEELLKRVRGIARRQQFFHWQLQFPDVFDRDQAGFDVVLSNPPWEHTELKEKEFFANRHPAIANAATGAIRKKMIDTLETEDKPLYNEFIKTKRTHDGLSHFVRNSGRNPLCGRGRINTYAIFAELARQVQSPAGRAGVIVPSGIATDDTTKFFFQDIMEANALASLYDFENRNAIFPGVHRSYKFCLLTLTGEKQKAKAAEFIFFALDTAHLRDEDRRFSLTAEEIALLNPNTRTCPIFRSKRDAELTKSIYRRVPVLIKEGPPEENPWGVSFRQGLFNMTSDSHLFRTREQLEEDGWQLQGNRFIRGSEVYLPLYEAKMFHQYDHRWASFNALDISDVYSSQKNNPAFYVLPKYWLPKLHVSTELKGRTERKWLVSYRRIARSTDARTVIAGIAPSMGLVDKLPIILNDANSGPQLACLVGNLNSLPCDFAARQKIGGTQLDFLYLRQFPVVAPHRYIQEAGWLGAQGSLVSWILPRSLELTYTAWDLQSFARDCGYDGPPFRWDEERRFLLRCELDAAYFHLYGIARHDVDYIMETFPIVRRKEIQKHGEYRTQRVILEIYDEMAAAMRTGTPYQTRLNPPPADPRMAHPARE